MVCRARRSEETRNFEIMSTFKSTTAESDKLQIGINVTVTRH